MFIRQLNNELLKMFARKRSWIGFIGFVALQGVIFGFMQSTRRLDRMIERLNGQFSWMPGFEAENYIGGLTLAQEVIERSYILIGALYISLVAGDIVAKDVEDGTIRMTLSRPISRVRLLAVKWCACSIYTMALMVFLGLTALGLATAWRGGLANLYVSIWAIDLRVVYDSAEGLQRYLTAVVLMGVCMTAVSTLGFLFSCMKMKPAAAAIVTLSVLFIDMVVSNLDDIEPYQHWFISYHLAGWIRIYTQEIDWAGIFKSWGYLVVLQAMCFGVGTWLFCRRDLKT